MEGKDGWRKREINSFEKYVDGKQKWGVKREGKDGEKGEWVGLRGEEWDLAMRPFWRTWRVLAGDSNLSAVLSKNLPIVLCTFVRGKTIKSMVIIDRRSFEILICRVFFYAHSSFSYRFFNVVLSSSFPPVGG